MVIEQVVVGFIAGVVALVTQFRESLFGDYARLESESWMHVGVVLVSHEMFVMTFISSVLQMMSVK